VTKVNVEIIMPIVGGRDFGDGTIDLPGLRTLRVDAHDAAFRRGFGRLALADLDVMASTVHRVDDEVMAVVDLVGKTARYDATDDGPRLRASRIVDDVVERGPRYAFSGHLAMHGLDDVAALAHPAQRVLHPLGEPPPSRRDFLGKAKMLQLLQAAGAQTLLEGVLVAGPDEAVPVHIAQHAAVEGGEAFLLHLPLKPILDLQIGTGTEIEGDEFRRAFAQALRDVVPGDDQILAPLILATKDDVGVRMARVVVIDRDPFELRAEVSLHLRHQTPGQRLQVLVLGAILRRDDEAELVAVAVSAFEERLAVSAVVLGVIERAWLTIACHAVALDIAQMRQRALHALSRELDDARFDDDAAAAKGGMAIARR
jgi:hypothetical protein